MGIAELESYMKSCLKDGWRDVSVEKEIENFRR
jgi:hypothetical protein